MRLAGQAAAAVEHAGAAWSNRSRDPNPANRARFAAEYALALLATHDPAQMAEGRQLLAAHVNPVQLPESAFTLREIAGALSEG